MTSLAQTIAKSMTQHDCPKENRAEKSEILIKIGLLEVIFKLTEPLNIDNLLFKKIVYKNGRKITSRLSMINCIYANPTDLWTCVCPFVMNATSAIFHTDKLKSKIIQDGIVGNVIERFYNLAKQEYPDDPKMHLLAIAMAVILPSHDDFFANLSCNRISLYVKELNAPDTTELGEITEEFCDSLLHPKTLTEEEKDDLDTLVQVLNLPETPISIFNIFNPVKKNQNHQNNLEEKKLHTPSGEISVKVTKVETPKVKVDVKAEQKELNALIKQLSETKRVTLIDGKLDKTVVEEDTSLNDNEIKYVTGILNIVEINRSKFYNFYPLLSWNGNEYYVVANERKELFSADGFIKLEYNDIGSSAQKFLQNLGNHSLVNLAYYSSEIVPDSHREVGNMIVVSDAVKEKRICAAAKDPNLAHRLYCVVTPKDTDEEFDFYKSNLVIFNDDDPKNLPTYFNQDTVVLRLGKNYYGPFKVKKNSFGDFSLTACSSTNSESFSAKLDVIQKLTPLSLEQSTFNPSKLILHPQFTDLDIILAGEHYIKYQIEDVIPDEKLLDIYVEEKHLNLSDVEETEKGSNEILEALDMSSSLYCEGFDDFTQGRFTRIKQLVSKIEYSHKNLERYYEIFKYCASSDEKFISQVCGVIEQDKKLKEDFAKNLHLEEISSQKKNEVKKLEAKLKELKEGIKDLDNETHEVDNLLNEKKELLVAFNNISLAQAELTRLENEQKELEAKITKAKEDYESFDNGIGKYEERLKNTTSIVASLAFDNEITSKIMRAANGANAKIEIDNDNRRLEIIKSINPINKKDNDLIHYLCSKLSEIRRYENSNIEYINLLACITQEFLTVLSGAPGSGKTSICNILGKALGLCDIDKTCIRDNWKGDKEFFNRYLQVSVERGWNSKRDFIGYHNPLTGTFESPDPKRYECFKLLEAEYQNGMDKLPYLVLFDEANLSPMEYYFADFMNICDRRDANSTISLSGTQRYHIPDTLRFLATINNDHTTDRLSPRLLDRAFVITLPNNGVQNKDIEDFTFEPINWNALKEAFTPRGSMTQKCKDIYAKVEDILMKLNLQLSYRCKNAVDKYVVATSRYLSDPKLETKLTGNEASVTALDYAIAQRVLPQIDVLGESYLDALEELYELFDLNNMNKCANIIKRIINSGSEMADYRFFKF